MNEQTIVLGPEEGERFYAGGDLYRFLAGRDETGGVYGLLEAVVPPGGGPPPHTHHKEAEAFYVVAGRVTFYSEGGETEATAGSFIHMPRDTKHWFRNHSDQSAKMIILLVPGGMEQMFREIGCAVTDPQAPIPPFGEDEKKRLLGVVGKYGVELDVPHH